MSGYTTIVNLLDYTASTIPVTTADKSIDIVDPGFKPLSKLDERVMKTCKFVMCRWVGLLIVDCCADVVVQMMQIFTMVRMSRCS
jgi:hypothetical protein